MTRLKSIKLSCPVCANQFTSRAIDSTDSLGGEHTDFHAKCAGMQSLAYLVHLCMRCGYAGTEAQFSGDVSMNSSIRRRVWNELAPRLSAATPTGSEKYEFAAKVATWRGEGPRRVGELWLRAAWCCVEEGDVEAERYYRRFAVWAFQEALTTYRGVNRDERALVTYLVGELWRRIGDEERAAPWFDKVASEITNPAKQQWVLGAARQQKEAPCEWFRHA